MPHLTAANTYLLTSNEGLVQHLSVKLGFSSGEESMADVLCGKVLLFF